MCLQVIISQIGDIPLHYTNSNGNFGSLTMGMNHINVRFVCVCEREIPAYVCAHTELQWARMFVFTQKCFWLCKYVFVYVSVYRCFFRVMSLCVLVSLVCLTEQNVIWNRDFFFYHYVGNGVCRLLRRYQVSLQCLFLPLEDWWWWSVGYLRVKRFESHSQWLKVLKRQADNRLVFWAAKTQKSCESLCDRKHLHCWSILDT